MRLEEIICERASSLGAFAHPGQPPLYAFCRERSARNRWWILIWILIWLKRFFLRASAYRRTTSSWLGANQFSPDLISCFFLLRYFIYIYMMPSHARLCARTSFYTISSRNTNVLKGHRRSVCASSFHFRIYMLTKIPQMGGRASASPHHWWHFMHIRGVSARNFAFAYNAEKGKFKSWAQLDNVFSSRCARRVYSSFCHYKLYSLLLGGASWALLII